jgi:hypothetical protein
LLQNVQRWVGKQMFTMQNEVVNHLQFAMILLELLTKNSVKDGISQFQDFCVNIHKFHTLFSVNLLQFG